MRRNRAREGRGRWHIRGRSGAAARGGAVGAGRRTEGQRVDPLHAGRSGDPVGRGPPGDLRDAGGGGPGADGDRPAAAPARGEAPWFSSLRDVRRPRRDAGHPSGDAPTPGGPGEGSMTLPKLACALACALLLLSNPALAAIGRVSLVEGVAHRVPSDTDTRSPRAGAESERLREGTGIELTDRITVEEGAHLKITLNDGSVVVVGGGSTLYIDEARFEGQERRGFGVFLEVGKLWAKVKKAIAGSDAKFEVTTERAV